MNGVLQILNLLGGLGLFLFGMRMMSDGIHKRAGLKLKRLLKILTSNRFAGVFTGFGVTSIIQSSSATTVLLVSLVNAGLMNLEQSIGVIMGANIGTTFTAWIVSLIGFKVKITSFALPAIAIAIPFFFSKSEKRREAAEIFLGFGILFLGLHIMKDSVPDIKNNPEILQFLTNLSDMGYVSVIVFIVIGTLLTIVVQSSSAAMAITLTMAFKGWIPFHIAAAIVLGENIGTTITAYLASLPMNVSAKQTARAHMLFNVVGVVWMVLLFFPVLTFIDFLVPGSVTDPAAIPIHLSAFHSFFNIANTLILVWFVNRIAGIVRLLVKEKDQAPGGEYRLPVIIANVPDRIEGNLVTVRKEVGKMAEIIDSMMSAAKTIITSKDGSSDRTFAFLKREEEKIDEMQEVLNDFLTECTLEAMAEEQARTVVSLQRIVNELESVADAIFRISLLLEKKSRKGLEFHKNSRTELSDFVVNVQKFLSYNGDFLNYRSEIYSFTNSVEMESELNGERDKLRKVAQSKLKKGADVKAELLFIDVVKHLEHVGDYSLNISAEIKGLLAEVPV